MTLLHIVVLALVQGISEFLPVSSSGHLALVPILTGWPDQGLIVDVAVHVGTLIAVLLYFWRDIVMMIMGLWRFVRGRKDPGARLAGLLVVATIPVVGAGYVLNDHFPDYLRSLEVIAWTTLGFGILLYIADKLGMTVRRIEHLRIGDAVIIGIAQVLALVPGTSRSGITMTAARIVGMERPDAARFSMLMSIPAILGAGTLKTLELIERGDAQLTSAALTAGGLAFVAALIAIAALMAWLKRASFTPFVIYRILLGGGLLALSYGWLK
ncbi:MAG: undecaprenyl-diphosphate phosphatase [Rhodospirillales bacterium]